MSAQAGILFRDTRPVPSEFLDTLTGFNSVLAPHRCGRYVSDGVALLSFALHFDKLSLVERQPVHLSDGSVLTWDGRLDNRDDLIIRLESELQGDYTDAHLVARAMCRWPDDTLERLIGDWSLVRWDSRQHELLVARDYAGNRPLYYYCHQDYFTWSTSMDALVAACGLAGQLNEPFVARVVMGTPRGEETWYKNLFHAPVGHSLVVDRSLRPRLVGFAHFRPASITLARQQDYETRYRELLTEAVKVRLRSRTTVWSELSGGYDSSSVTCIASGLVRSRSVEAPDLQMVSYVSSTSPESNETEFIESVETWCHRTTRFMPMANGFSFDRSAQSSASTYDPSTEDLMLEMGSTVILTGTMGDLIGGGCPVEFSLLDKLHRQGLVSSLEGSLLHCRNERKHLAALLRALLRTWLRADGTKRNDRERLHSAASLRRMTSLDPSKIFGLTPSLLAQVPPIAQQPVDDDIARLPRFAAHVAAGVRKTAREGFYSALRTSTRETRRSHPFMHRPLVNLVMSMPPSNLTPQETSRALLRSTLASVLPPRVLDRLSKGYAAPAASRSNRRVVMDGLDGENLRHWQLVARGYMGHATLSELLTTFVDGAQSTDVVVDNILTAETGLRYIGYTHRVSLTSDCQPT